MFRDSADHVGELKPCPFQGEHWVGSARGQNRDGGGELGKRQLRLSLGVHLRLAERALVSNDKRRYCVTARVERGGEHAFDLRLQRGERVFVKAFLSESAIERAARAHARRDPCVLREILVGWIHWADVTQSWVGRVPSLGVASREIAVGLSARTGFSYLRGPMADADKANELPDHEQAMSHALAVLADVGRALVRAPRHTTDRRPVAREIESAIVTTLDAYDCRREPLSSVRTAITHSDDARAQLAELLQADSALFELDAMVDKARGWLLVAERYFETHPTALRVAVPVAASGETPVLHDIARGTIAPVFDVAEPIAALLVAEVATPSSELPPKERMAEFRQRTEALRKDAAERRDARAKSRDERMKARVAEARLVMAPGMIEGRFEALAPRAIRRDKARELLVEIAAMGAQRTPRLGDYWRGASVFDLRLLRAVDAIAALGADGVEPLEALFMDSPAKDASHVFAICFALGSFEGRDALAAIERVLRDVALEDPTLVDEAIVALKLVPTNVGPLLRGWVSDPEPALRMVAVDVLGHRGLLSDKKLLSLAEDPDERVAARAIMQTCRTKPNGLGAVLDQHLQPKTEALRNATAWAAVLGGVSFPVDRLRARIDSGDIAACALPFALAAEREDGQRLVELFDRSPSRVLAEALGFFGDPTSLQLLVSMLEREEVSPEVRQAVAFALMRITGAELFEKTLVEPDLEDPVDPPDPPLPDLAGKGPIRKGERRDPPAKGAPDEESLPTQDPTRWRAYLEEEDVRFQGERRTRRGSAYTPEQSIDELANFQVTPEERRLLYREIVVKSGTDIRFDPVDFVAVQENAIVALETVCARASSMPGAYGCKTTRVG